MYLLWNKNNSSARPGALLYTVGCKDPDIIPGWINCVAVF